MHSCGDELCGWCYIDLYYLCNFIMIYLNIVVVKSSVVSGEERYGGYVRKGIGTMELEVDEMLVELRQNAEYTDNYDIASDNHLV